MTFHHNTRLVNTLALTVSRLRAKCLTCCHPVPQARRQCSTPAQPAAAWAVPATPRRCELACSAEQWLRHGQIPAHSNTIINGRFRGVPGEWHANSTAPSCLYVTGNCCKPESMVTLTPLVQASKVRRWANAAASTVVARGESVKTQGTTSGVVPGNGGCAAVATAV